MACLYPNPDGGQHHQELGLVTGGGERVDPDMVGEVEGCRVHPQGRPSPNGGRYRRWRKRDELQSRLKVPADLMPNAEARFAPGHGYAWLAVEPELHVRMVEAWITGQEVPAELPPETTEWPSSRVQRLLDARRRRPMLARARPLTATTHSQPSMLLSSRNAMLRGSIPVKGPP